MVVDEVVRGVAWTRVRTMDIRRSKAWGRVNRTRSGLNGGRSRRTGEEWKTACRFLAEYMAGVWCCAHSGSILDEQWLWGNG